MTVTLFSEVVAIYEVDTTYSRKTYLRSLYEKQGGRCFYTGVEMKIRGKFKADPLQMSLDRKNSSRGYVAGNVVLCCLGVNLLKGSNPARVMFEALEVLSKGARRANTRKHSK